MSMNQFKVVLLVLSCLFLGAGAFTVVGPVPTRTPTHLMGQKRQGIRKAITKAQKKLGLKKEQKPYVQSTGVPKMTRKVKAARAMAKNKGEEQKLAEKYEVIDSVEEKAYQIAIDLGMVEDSS